MIAVILYGDNPEGIPGAWPKKCRENVSSKPAGWDLLLADITAYENYLQAHYAAYAAWRDGLPDIPEVPQELSRRKFLMGMVLCGILPAMVDAAIEQIPDETERLLVQLDWGNCGTVRRDYPLLQSMAQGMGISSHQVDTIFITGKSVPD